MGTLSRRLDFITPLMRNVYPVCWSSVTALNAFGIDTDLKCEGVEVLGAHRTL